MAISHGALTRTALCNTTVDRVDLGGGTTLGQMRFLTAGDNLLCTITLQNPAFGAASGASAPLLGVPLSGTISAGGTAAKFRITDSDGVTIIEGTVGTSGQDVNISSVAFEINSVVQIDALTYISSV